MASVEVEHVVKHYDTADAVTLMGAFTRPPALDDVTIRLEDGETVSLVGASGCGKSTLLKVVAGLETPDRGRVLFNGMDVTAMAPQDRGVGMVFQDYALYPSMGAREIWRTTSRSTSDRKPRPSSGPAKWPRSWGSASIT